MSESEETGGECLTLNQNKGKQSVILTHSYSDLHFSPSKLTAATYVPTTQLLFAAAAVFFTVGWRLGRADNQLYLLAPSVAAAAVAAAAVVVVIFSKLCSQRIRPK